MNDSANTITFAQVYNGQELAPLTAYVLGYNGRELLLTGNNDDTVSTLLSAGDNYGGVIWALSLDGTDLGKSAVGTALSWNVLSWVEVSAAAAISQSQSSTASTPFEIVDSAANIQASLTSLYALYPNKIGIISLTDSGTPSFTLAYGDKDSVVLADVAGNYSLTYTNVTASASYLFSDPNNLYGVNTHVTSIAVVDITAAVLVDLDYLEKVAEQGKLASITLTDAGTTPLALTPTQYADDGLAIAKISGSFTTTVLGTLTSGSSFTGVLGHGTTLSFSGNASDYTITPAGNGTSFTLSGGSSTYSLTNVTELQFADHTEIVAQTPGSAVAATTGNITELYAAVFGRLPDVSGLSFYQSYLNAHPSTPLLQFAEWFLSSSEYTSAHSYAQTTAGDTQFINDSYQNLLHRTPSSDEVNFYLDKVINKALTGLTAGTQAYSNAEFQAHAQMLVYFSASTEFLSNVQVTATTPASAQHWLVLI